MDLAKKAVDIATDPYYSRFLSPLLLLGDAALSLLIIRKVPYTEIDWKAYMEQVAQYKAGELNYRLIKGGTGPLVYPAAHVYIYSFLYDLTDSGKNILTAQYIFAALYIATLFLALQVYRKAGAPPYILPLLVLSKRLHSIYVLRLFNDCFSVFFLWAGVLAWQYRLWTAGAILYSLSVGVKMSAVLILPAVGFIYLMGVGRARAIQMAILMAQVQFVLAYPFAKTYPREYLSRAFEFTRQFLFKWTVNWRFVGEETFLSKPFSLGLLAVHVTLLGGFALTRWLRPSGRTTANAHTLITHPPSGFEERLISIRVDSKYILTAVLSANAIGMLCARSLHYQFYSWLAWGTPYLLWQSGLGPVWVFVIWAAQEWAWNVFPSTNVSSAVVVTCLALAVAGIWVGTEEAALKGEVEEEEVAAKKKQ